MIRASSFRSSLLVLALASLAACSAGSAPSESVGRAEDALFANDQAAFDYFLGKGLTNYQAAGIVGNLDQESGGDPLAVQSGGPGRGIAQWSVGGRWDTDGNDNATWYAGQQGQSVHSLQLQLDFIWYELTTFPAFGLAQLQASSDVAGAATVFQDKFEICGTCDSSQRIAYAQDVLAAYGNDTAPDGGTVDAGAGPTCTVPGLGDGVCIATSDCAAMPGYVSTPGYCPGPADEQCCTGPMGSTTTAVATTGTGDASTTGSSSGGAPQNSTTSTGSLVSGAGGSGGSMTSSASASLSGNPVTEDSTTPGSCAAAPSEDRGSLSSLGLIGLAAASLRRRRRTER